MADPGAPDAQLTFLFTDVEGSTRLWEQAPEAMRSALDQHTALLHQQIAAHSGQVFKALGEAVYAVFPGAPAAVTTAAVIQHALAAAGDTAPLGLLGRRVRIALHTGPAEQRDADYFGPTLNRVARLLAAAHGGQIVLSQATATQCGPGLPAGASLRDLGARRLRDLTTPERIFQLIAPGLPADFPPLATLDARPTNLPAPLTALIGRDAERAAAHAALRRADLRLLTLTGPGGTGKTRLSLQLAADLLDDFEQGVWFVALAPIREATLVGELIATALGVAEAAGQTPLAALKTQLRDQQVLLVLDNFEQVMPAAPLVGELLAAAPRLK